MRMEYETEIELRQQTLDNIIEIQGGSYEGSEFLHDAKRSLAVLEKAKQDALGNDENL